MVAVRKSKREADPEPMNEDTGEAEVSGAETSQAAPLEAPAVKPPPQPSGLVPMAPNAVAMHAGEDWAAALFDEHGDEISADAIFDYPTADRPGTMAIVNRRVYQRFSTPNASTPGLRLLYPKGAQVPIWEAERVKRDLTSSRAAPAL